MVNRPQNNEPRRHAIRPKRPKKKSLKGDFAVRAADHPTTPAELGRLRLHDLPEAA